MNVLKSLIEKPLMYKDIVSIKEPCINYHYTYKFVNLCDETVAVILSYNLIFKKNLFDFDKFYKYGLVIDYKDFVVNIPFDELRNLQLEIKKSQFMRDPLIKLNFDFILKDVQNDNFYFEKNLDLRKNRYERIAINN